MEDQAKRKIIIRKRADDYHAHLAHSDTALSEECYWGCGDTMAEAIGLMIMAHSHSLNIEIELSANTEKSC